MKFKNFFKTLLLSVIFIFFSSITFANGPLCGSDVLNLIIQKDPRNMEYNEDRNDAGIHFVHAWDGKDKIVIKRNENKFPIVRYSLFDNKNFIPNKTVIKKIGNNDLSKLSDNELEKFTYLKGKIDFELENGTIITISSKPYKFNNYRLSNLKILSIQNIDTTKGILEMSFDSKFTNTRKDLTKVYNNENLSFNRKINICRDARYEDDWPLQSV